MSEISATANNWLKITSQGDEQVEIYKLVLLPEEDGQQNREILDHEDEYELQTLPTNEEILAEWQKEDIPLDLESIPDNVEDWVRRSTRSRRQPKDIIHLFIQL